MTDPRITSSAHDDVGAYLLGALDAGGSRAFERHLEGCAACREEVARLRPAIGALARSADPVTPSPALKRDLLARAREEMTPRKEPARARKQRRGLGSWFSLPRAGVAWGAAAVLVLSGVAGGYAFSQLSDEGGGERKVLAAQVDRKAQPDASARLVVPEGGGPAELRVKGMKLPPPGEVYEIWLRRPGGGLEPAGVFTVTRDGEGRATVDGEVVGSDQVMVTQERAGGVKQPTGAPVLAVSL